MVIITEKINKNTLNTGINNNDNTNNESHPSKPKVKGDEFYIFDKILHPLIK